MSKSYTTGFKKITNAVSAGEYPLICLEIDREDLVDPIRVVNDNAELVHNANTFLPVPFLITLPDEPESGLGQAQLTIMNVGRELTAYLEGVDWTSETTCRVIQVLRSSANTVQWEITMNLTDVAMNALTITGKLGFEDLYGMPAVTMKYSPVVAPGLF